MKRKPVCILSLVAAGIILGYLFFVGWLLSFLVAKYIAGKASGKQGRVRSFILPFGKYKVHFHHWLISSGIIIVSLITNVCFLSTAIFYGALSGLVFQGIYYYNDWHKIVITRRHQNIENAAVHSAEHLLFIKEGIEKSLTLLLDKFYCPVSLLLSRRRPWGQLLEEAIVERPK